MDEKAMKRLFKQYTFLKRKTLPEGIEVGAGWEPIVTELFQTLSDLPPPASFVVTKVFNRHGKLQVWTTGGCNSTRLAIEAAVDRSEEICEACGNPVELGKCDKCKEEEYVEPEATVDATAATVT